MAPIKDMSVQQLPEPGSSPQPNASSPHRLSSPLSSPSATPTSSRPNNNDPSIKIFIDKCKKESARFQELLDNASSSIDPSNPNLLTVRKIARYEKMLSTLKSNMENPLSEYDNRRISHERWIASQKLRGVDPIPENQIAAGEAFSNGTIDLSKWTVFYEGRKHKEFHRSKAAWNEFGLLDKGRAGKARPFMVVSSKLLATSHRAVLTYDESSTKMGHIQMNRSPS
ncbi:hypothetical protein BJ508DRAFT_367582 [Ascobolus immersus RN42]|uniref:Uncharacterized protein n=1 Tax=Ascobolus immersus RN42 TaxID=1160509 RepID=A0A3N4HBF7_ASCIM|nr:hypothetical protein BJ508DRAFT_367582 [Ascobolus immersus RN42]